MIKNDWKLAIMLLGGIALHTFVTLAYRAPQTVEYLMPAYVLMAIVVGYGLRRFENSGARSQKDSRPFWILDSKFLAALTIALLFINHFSSFRWLQPT